MNREDIIRMAREAGMSSLSLIDIGYLERFAALVAAAERNKLAAWMIQFGFATGHGDTMEELVDALGSEIVDRIEIEIDCEREACAELVWPTRQVKTWSDEELTAMTGAFNKAQEKHGWYETIMAVGSAALKGRAAAIRAKGKT